ncbi:DUF3828 domain-containing protein [Chitinophaga silvatica]|uniref:DUF3828 domain-containing protein n=1 Tax=Chitinophaga silvatica TaxID=2282649 RepID=A0A3E1Y2V1_9BACT|nr:DUF3828 domain-containing protein [Chitinophaga silvatica]RFS18956.1 DUF3828 domain-containing protein [Chitinophaga silvatica]
MRAKNTLLIIFSFIVYSCQHSTTPKQNEENDPAQQTLKQFYTGYLTADGVEDESKSDSLKTKYCTKQLLKKIKHKMKTEELDYDPLLNAQDVSREWLQTMTFTKVPQSSDTYEVSYLDPYDKKKITIKLHVAKVEQEYKIDSIIGL